MIQYKDALDTDKKIIALEQQEDDDLLLSSYYNFFDDLYSDDTDVVSNAIVNLLNIAEQNITIFKDCVAFTKVLEITDNPIFDDYIVALRFFDKITSKSINDEAFLARFISQSFLSTLKNFLFTNFENPDFFRILFNIYGNIIYCSECFSKEIISLQFLTRLYEIVEHIPKTSDYFLDLLGCILLRFRILMDFSIDPFPKIIQVIRFFIESPDFILFSNAFSTLAQASSITFPPFIKAFFVPFIILKTSDVIAWPDQSNEENMIQIGQYTIHRQSLFALKKDALSIILNFSAIDEETRSQLIDIGLIDLDCTTVCFLNADHDESDNFNDFYEEPNKKDFILVQNDLDSSLLPKIAANFFTDNHSNAIRFAYSNFWKSLIKNYEWFNFDTKQEIARAISLSLSFHDEDLITTILSDDTISQVILSLTECFSNNTIKLEVNLILAIDNLIGLFCVHPNIKEINVAFSSMIYSDLVHEINEFYINEENKISTSLCPIIERILSFFEDYSSTNLSISNDHDDKDTENINEFSDDFE